ncbi:MAG: class I SAM-dependent methyltransferase [Methylacidiphilales bacterium]|nr:class I SAM-dependent methyltransferase [Candidatus Methylacidiphilales bacterium]
MPEPLHSPLRQLAAWLAASFLLQRGRTIHENHPDDWKLNQSAADKIWASLYLIAKDYSTGEFPPRPTNQSEVYQQESDYLQSIPGENAAAAIEREMRKPFWPSDAPWLSGVGQYLNSFLFLLKCFSQAETKPPARLLELGCGSGWMAEFLALYGYDVVATNLASTELDIAQIRARLLHEKKCGAKLKIVSAAMESVGRETEMNAPFDAVYVHEALHHAFDWKKVLKEVHRLLGPGGFFFICNEPNAAHTFICYRSAKILKTHEIGFHRSGLVQELKAAGFTEVTVIRPFFNNLVSPFWIRAKK